MRTWLAKFSIAMAVLAGSWNGAQAGFGVRIGIGVPFPYPYYYGPYYRPYYYGYPYYGPVVVAAPAPAVVVQSAPATVVAPAPSGSGYQGAPPSSPSPPQTLPAPAPLSSAAPAAETAPPPLAPVVARAAAPDLSSETDRLLQLLRDPGEGARMSAVMQLGRNHVLQAVEPITQILNSDPSARVRDAAARALGLIESPSSLKALQTAAQADDDREVRHSAQFAAEVIRSNLRR